MATTAPTVTSESAGIWTLPHQDVSVPTARRLARAHLCRGQLAPDTIDTALLLLTELLTNAVRHGHGPYVTFAVSLLSGQLILSVTDTGNGGPRTRHRCDALSESGRGLDIVATLAAAWSVRRTAAGHTIWAIIRL
ncbi:ATP-binding protein [Streptomyces iranensis]|uniref:Anti-sigma regulatory factor (Ser/Thr protein kinase) n=1 Tax=Streptomyces iranensis TaxID=576784 RepID=A0A061A666_9ACTN|nr:ATP-binding protein [Streptomyces iranensis]MBP2066157.1 anti-sigma regulatory factor (Ser/Thr protein kinase) [Streptomyces iranensis]CDR13183.1 magnesium or manganese-dependent proteinphosphatase [Streptomyces iranensis]